VVMLISTLLGWKVSKTFFPFSPYKLADPFGS